LTRYRFPERVVAKGLRGTFREMGELDIEIAGKLVDLLKSQQTEIADEMRDLDDKIDALHVKVFGKVLDEAWGGTTADTVDATLASRYHERFGDHAVSISKKVKYLSTGDWTDQGDSGPR
jgi:phosphate transport system protein